MARPSQKLEPVAEKPAGRLMLIPPLVILSEAKNPGTVESGKYRDPSSPRSDRDSSGGQFQRFFRLFWRTPRLRLCLICCAEMFIISTPADMETLRHPRQTRRALMEHPRIALLAVGLLLAGAAQAADRYEVTTERGV